MEERLQDLRTIDPRRIQARIDAGQDLILQYSQPIYTPSILRAINRVCETHGERINVRFYGHAFDGAVLRQLPAVRSLCLDFIHAPVPDFDALFELPQLRNLALLIEGLERPDALGADNLRGLTSLRIGGKPRKPYDLSFLTRMGSLRHLMTSGRFKNIEAAGSIGGLETLRIWTLPKTVRLDFLDGHRRLRRLNLFSCGQGDLDGFALPALERLEIYGMRGLSRLTPDPFPALKELQLESMSRLESIDFSSRTPRLELIKIIRCKALTALPGLGRLAGLRHLRISDSGIVFDDLIRKPLPPKLKIFAFYGKGAKAIRARLDSMGYSS